MKYTIIKHLRGRRQAKAREAVGLERAPSRMQSINESLYSNRTTFLRRAVRKIGLRGKVSMKPEELRRFSSIQTARSGTTLARNPSRQMQQAQNATAAGGAGEMPKPGPS
jgi:H+-transporting ATPase